MPCKYIGILYSCIYEDEFNEKQSIHIRGNCANVDCGIVFDEKLWNTVLNIVADVRRYKSEKNISIKEVVEKITVYTNVDISVCIDDLKNVCNVGKIEVKQGECSVEF